MTRLSKYLLYLQYFLGRLSIFIIGPLVILVLKLMRYRIHDLAKLRGVIRELLEKHRGPWIICPNHLTMIDSLILAYALVPLHRYMVRYQLLPWNLPERANFQRNIFLTILCYLSKCIPISRGGDRKQIKNVMGKCSYLLTKGENVLIFPEGGRSRTGRVEIENVSYGVGRLINAIPDCRIMCVYMRGDNQVSHTTFPCFGEQFKLKIDTFTPVSTERGLKAQRNNARQIIERLARMEEKYFASHRQRHSGFDRSSRKREKPGHALY
jgi:1-acyl-sn-glycerol-3-phosphate acyltransferase